MVPGITDVNRLGTLFASLVSGVRENGCGLEAQLESWYHFLVQPDPYSSVIVGDGSSISERCTLGVGCRIGASVTVARSVTIADHATVGSGAFVGEGLSIEGDIPDAAVALAGVDEAE